ncbi:MAG: FAD-binding oxidoreductase [Pyrinomonadaceae bacterium]
MNTPLKSLEAIVGRNNVISQPDELLVYECDGLPQHKHRPLAVVFPSSTEEVASVMRELAHQNVPFTPRGAGTGLSGGALALNAGVVIEMARMRRILKVDAANRFALVQPGVVNLQVSRAAAPYGLYYVPDPSSQPTCTIGGNIAESAGGIHCLKYGTTTDHIIACTVVLAGGDVVELGGPTDDVAYNLVGAFVGSEGTFGIVTEATLRLVPIPPAIRTLLAEFGEVNDASHAVSAIIAAGVMPAALEMMDHEIIRAVEASVFAAGLPPDAGAALLIELDGIDAGLDDETDRVAAICLENGAANCRRARDDAERKKLWAARKGAFGAIGRISPDSMIQDAVVPRSRLPQVLASAYEIAARHQLRIANVFHAGDGNLHPLICFDSRFADQVARVKEAGRELMQVCVAAGGTITGEHGVGLDKRELLPLVFSDADMNLMLRVRAAFDPIGLCNPGKIIPILRGCGEARAVESSVTAVATPARETSPNGHVFTPAPPATTAVMSSRSIAMRFDLQGAIKELRDIVGDQNVEVVAGSSTVTVTPESEEQVSTIVRLGSRHHWTVAPAGRMYWQLLQKTCANVIVSTRKLNHLLEHEPADLVAIAEAGLTLRELNIILERNGQWLPLDPPDDGRATLGGVVGAGMGGAQQIGYGRPRGSVIGMRVVLANGDVVKTGGRVVKNVAGYDLSKLFTGSYGSLGIITQLNFKLRPRPTHEATVIATGNAKALIKAGQSILDAPLFPVAVELISSSTAKSLGIATPDANCTLMVRFAGNEKGVAYQNMRAASLLARDSNFTEVLTNDTELWQLLAALPIAANHRIGWRATVVPSATSNLIEMVDDESASRLWQLGVGDGRLRMIDNTERTSEETINNFFNLHEHVQSLAGQLVVERLGPELTLNGRLEGVERVRLELARRVKQQLDPQSVFIDLI